MAKKAEEHLNDLFQIALVLLGILSATETQFFIKVFGEVNALKLAITPYIFMILIWIIKEFIKNRLPIEHSLLYSEFCWLLWSLSLTFYLFFFYFYMIPTIPIIAIISSMATGLSMYGIIWWAYMLEYSKTASTYFNSSKWLLVRFVIAIVGLILFWLTFSTTPHPM